MPSSFATASQAAASTTSGACVASISIHVPSGACASCCRYPSRTRSWNASPSRPVAGPPRSPLLPPQPHLRRQVEVEGQVGDQSLRSRGVRLRQAFQVQTPPVPLVRDRARPEAVAQDRRSARQRGLDDAVYELRPRQQERERLGPRRERLAEQLPCLFAGGCASWLPHLDRVDARLLQPARESGGQQALARSLAPLEGDEAPYQALAGHRPPDRGGSGRMRTRRSGSWPWLSLSRLKRPASSCWTRRM